MIEVVSNLHSWTFIQIQPLTRPSKDIYFSPVPQSSESLSVPQESFLYMTWPVGLMRFTSISKKKKSVLEKWKQYPEKKTIKFQKKTM